MKDSGLEKNTRRMEPDSRAVGRSIRELRRRRHLLQSELAARIGMKAAPLCNIETGKNSPSLRSLCRISEALGVTVNEILHPQVYLEAQGHPPLTVREPSEEHAEYGDDPYARLRRRGIARVTWVPGETVQLGPRLLSELERAIHDTLAREDLCGACKSATIPLHVPFTQDSVGAQQLAYTVRKHCGIGSAVVFDYIELFENHGLRIFFLPLPCGLESLSFYDRDNANAFLVLGDGFNPEKQLFRLAVELAHIYLFTANRCAPLRETAALRRFAKTFASFFLMPEESVRATVLQLGIGPTAWSYELLLRIKHRFGVSAEAFAHRLEEVGALDPELRQEFKRRIRAHYAETGFGEPDASRRILSRNGRAGDLLLCARRNPANTKELAAISRRMARRDLRTTSPSDSPPENGLRTTPLPVDPS